MLCSSLCSPTKWLHNLPASEVWEISLDRCDGHTVLCSEEQKSAVRHRCPGPHLTPINFEQRKKKMGMKHFPEWKSCAPLFVSKLLHRAAVTQEWPHNILAMKSLRCELGSHLQVVGYQSFQGHQCIPQLLDLLLALGSFGVSNFTTPVLIKLIQPLNTEIHEL